MKEVICRQDTAKNNVLFLLDSVDKEGKHITMWQPDAKENDLIEVSLDFFRMTKPATDTEASNTVNKYVAQEQRNLGSLKK